MINELVYFDEITQSLSKAVYHANANLKNTMGLLKMIISQEMWRKRIVTITGEVVEFQKFEQYVVAQPPEGLGTNIETLKFLCCSDASLVELIDRAVAPPPLKFTASSQMEEAQRPARFSKEWTLKRLQEAGRKDLIKRLKRDDVTPYSVQIEMGWRKKA